MNLKETVVYQQIRRFWYRIKYEKTPRNYINRVKYRDVLKSLKNIHKGERCFIIGNGPSLTAKDLTLLKDEYSFAANRIFYMFDKTEWRPTFYCCQDLVVMKDISDEIEKVSGQFKTLFFNSNGEKYFSRSFVKKDNVFFFYPKYKTGYEKVMFSENIDEFVFDGGSITYAAIQIAVYMGFKDIYLIGVDHNYSAASFNKNEISKKDVTNSYFEGMPSNIKMTKPNLDGSTQSFLKAKDFCDSHNVNIYNATRGGKLEIFQRKQLEEILK